MIIKQRVRPVKISGYESLLTRMPSQHPKREYIGDLLYSANAGIGGEERLDGCLEFFDPPYSYRMIRDLSLPERCQIDTLLITQSEILILEVKNMSGKLRLQRNPSVLEQTLQNGQVKYFKSPLIQMETAKIKVEKIARRHNLGLPIKTALVLAYPSQYIENIPADATVWNADEVMYHLHQANPSKPLISLDEMDRLGMLLLSQEQPHKPFPLLPNLKINTDTINKGVICPLCCHKEMKRLNRRWFCSSCKFFSQNAHLKALDEWFMLFKSTINVQECMQFLGLQNKHAARRMLKNMNLEETGSRQFRSYRLKENHEWQ